MPGLNDHDRWLIDRAHLLRTADVCEHTGERDPALAYALWAGEAKVLFRELVDLVERLADRLEQLGS